MADNAQTQLKEEKERSASLRCQLTSTMQELEELTRSLFEEANQVWKPVPHFITSHGRWLAVKREREPKQKVSW